MVHSSLDGVGGGGRARRVLLSKCGWDELDWDKGTAPMLCRNNAHEVEVSDGEQGGEGRKLSQIHMEGGVAWIEEREVGRGLTEGFFRIKLLNI